jgi:hypothetical protein
LESSAITETMISDVLTRDQYYDGIRGDDPCARPIKRLLLAVLEDAMRCYQTYADSRNRAQRRLFVDAEMWLMDRRATSVFSFETVCENLGIDPSCLRAGLRRWRLQQLNGMNPSRLTRRSPVTSTSRISAPLKRSRRKAADPTVDGDDGRIAVAANGGNGGDHNSSDVADDAVNYRQRGVIYDINATDAVEESLSSTEAGEPSREASVPPRQVSVSPREVWADLQEIALA